MTDLTTVATAQLGRPPRGLRGAAHTCSCGLPDVLETAPRLMREAETRGGVDGDNVSAIIVRWGPETLADEPTTTDNLALGQFETQVESTLTLTDRAGKDRDLTEDEIERAIAEIQSTIQKYRK